MKKKGFTLIELVGVIAILGVISIFAVPALTKTLKQAADKEYNEFVKNVTLAAENYFHNETDGNIANNSRIFIQVKELMDKEYLKKTVNPMTKTDVSDEATVIISKNEDGTEKYTFVDQNVTTSGYVTDGLILQYDGYTAPVDGVWPDLSGNNHNGIINGASWLNDKYYFDGVDDYIDTGIDLASNLGINKSSTISITFNLNNVTNIGNQYGKVDEGLIFGGINYGGYGISWVTDNNESQYLLRWTYRTNAQIQIVQTGLYGINKQMNLVYVFDYENKKIIAYIDGKKYGQTNFTVNDGELYAYAVDNIKINGLGISVGNSRRAYSNMNVYSANIYNRALTEAEVKQNYEVDKYRFGDGE